MQKTYLFSVQIEMPLANLLKSVGNTDTFLLLVSRISITIKVKVSWQQIFIQVSENRKE
jgi:hypothetical protein